MTSTVPDVDVTSIEHLDFTAPVPCNVDACGDDPIRARPAIATLVLTMPCCTRRAPVCGHHVAVHSRARLEHLAVICPDHYELRCTHDAISFEPLHGSRP